MTYTVEPATDEYDIVKYDGSTLAIAPSRSGCCFILEDMALPARRRNCLRNNTNRC